LFMMEFFSHMVESCLPAMRDLETVAVGELLVVKGFTYATSYASITGNQHGNITSDTRLEVGMPVIVTNIGKSRNDGIFFFELLTSSGYARVFAGPRRWQSIFGDQ
jgi:hypothetical protein